MSALDLAVIALFGAIGCVLRHAVTLAMPASPWPWATFLCNVAGAFAIGLIAALLARSGLLTGRWRLALMTGLLGGFTTYSAFALDAVTLIERRQLAAALTYALATTAAALLACAAGLWLARR